MHAQIYTEARPSSISETVTLLFPPLQASFLMPKDSLQVFQY